MKLRKQAQDADRGGAKRTAARPASRLGEARAGEATSRRAGLETAAARAFGEPGSMTARDVLRLQNTLGNRAVTRLLSGVTQRKAAAGGLDSKASRAAAPAGTRATSPALAGRAPLPEALRAGVENLSGIYMSDVRVHYNSPEPARLRAAAHTRGGEIHLAPGQERHLPHEAWHVVQQKQGRVRPTGRLGGEAVNRDQALESEADAMGARAESAQSPEAGAAGGGKLAQAHGFHEGEGVIQGVFVYDHDLQLFVDEDTGETYELLGTIGYGLGRRAYQLSNTLTDEYVEVDQQTMEVVDTRRDTSLPSVGGFPSTFGSSSSPFGSSSSPFGSSSSPFGSSSSPFGSSSSSTFNPFAVSSSAPNPFGTSSSFTSPFGTPSFDTNPFGGTSSSNTNLFASTSSPLTSPFGMPPFGSTSPTFLPTGSDADTTRTITNAPSPTVPSSLPFVLPQPSAVKPTEEKKEEKGKEKDEGDKKRKREAEESSDDSDFSSSEDDETTTLTSTQKLKVMVKKGKYKRQRLTSKSVPKVGESFPLHDPRSRKVYGAHRSSKKPDAPSNINNQELVLIGAQTIRIGEGTGYFVQPGGNKETRPKKIKEPPADYKDLFEQMKGMGRDANSAKLYKLATGKELGEKDTLTDAEVAAIALYYMNNDASVIHATHARTQLTEHLSKAAGITNISEFSRALEAMEGAEESPYDATLLVKQGLASVAAGEKTLRQIFYEGTGGEKSVFIGAPSMQHAPSGIGGAEVLRNPFAYGERLDRQMSIFPDNKKEFKAALNALKSQSVIKLPELTEEQRKEQEKASKLGQVMEAEALLAEIQAVKIPSKVEEFDEFLNQPKGATKSYQRAINGLKKKYSGNKEALAKLADAQKELNQKRKDALAKL